MLVGIAFALLLLVVLFLRCSGPPRPSIPAGLLPKEAAAIVRALGSDGLSRVIQVISPNNQPSLVSGGTHMASGVYRGQPYGLAFDIAIADPNAADADVHRLRMQGIAAWRRGPGAPGGGDNLGPHIHCVWPGAPTHNIQNREQVSSFVHGYRGVIEPNRDKRTWRDPTITPEEIRCVRLAYEAQFGAGSLKRMPSYELRHHAAYASDPDAAFKL